VIEAKGIVFGGHIYQRQAYATADQRLAITETSAGQAIRVRAL